MNQVNRVYSLTTHNVAQNAFCYVTEINTLGTYSISKSKTDARHQQVNWRCYHEYLIILQLKH